MWTTFLEIGAPILAAITFIAGIVIGVMFKGWLIARAEAAKKKFDDAVEKAVNDLKKRGI